MTTHQQAMFPDLVDIEDTHATIAAQFAEFHARNPWIADTLEAWAAQRVGLGWSRVGVKSLWERLRDDWRIQTGGSRWKANNSFTAHYARLLLERHPEWVGVIETRRLRDGGR